MTRRDRLNARLDAARAKADAKAAELGARADASKARETRSDHVRFYIGLALVVSGLVCWYLFTR